MAETHAFQSDIARLLELLSHSLYQNREIALRELVSNASDALDKRRHLGLTDEAVRAEGDLSVDIACDADAKTLTVGDNGIGMSREDLIENLGTIAKSGTLAFAEQAAKAGASSEGGKGADPVSLIGQFGVGFYSAFMLADTVEVVTRKAGTDAALRWTSEGTGEFTIEEAERDRPGTDVILRLKDDEEAGKFADEQFVRGVVRKYSTFIPYPVFVNGDTAGDQRPIWVEPKSQVTDEQYNEFYKHLSGYPMDPLWHLHLSFDSPLQVSSILYCPVSNMETMGFGKYEQGLSLCAKRVLVQDDCRKLLPEYLRFVSGLVDSDDLPLNVSREALQDSAVFGKIQKVLVKKTLDFLDDLSKEDADKYGRFYAQFGGILREGVNDFANKDRVAKLLRFDTSHGDEKTSLAEYVDRLKPEQEQIFYASGPSRDAVLAGPHASAITAAGCEVLVLTDPVDEFVLNGLGEFDGKPLVPADSEDADLPGGGDDADAPTTPANFSSLVGVFGDALGEKVTEVRASLRLKAGGPPAALVNPKGTPSSQMQRVMNAYDPSAPLAPRIMELNAGHPLIDRLSQIAGNEQNADFLKLTARELYRTAALADGLPVDPTEAAADAASLLEEVAKSKSSIVT